MEKMQSKLDIRPHPADKLGVQVAARYFEIVHVPDDNHLDADEPIPNLQTEKPVEQNEA